MSAPPDSLRLCSGAYNHCYAFLGAPMDAEQKETTEFFLESWLCEAVGRCNSFLNNVNRPFSLHDSFN